MTKREAFRCYKSLRALNPDVLTEPVLNDVIDATQALEPLARELRAKKKKHLERVCEGEEPTAEEKEEVREAMDNVKAEECDIAPPSVDLTDLRTVGAIVELRSIEELAPVLSQKQAD